jgi:hypothetical protein
LGAARRCSKWFFQRAGFSPPLRRFFAFAQLKMRSMRPRMRDAVSCFVAQIGLRTRSTWSVSILSTAILPMTGKT